MHCSSEKSLVQYWSCSSSVTCHNRLHTAVGSTHAFHWWFSGPVCLCNHCVEESHWDPSAFPWLLQNCCTQSLYRSSGSHDYMYMYALQTRGFSNFPIIYVSTHQGWYSINLLCNGIFLHSLHAADQPLSLSSFHTSTEHTERCLYLQCSKHTMRPETSLCGTVLYQDSAPREYLLFEKRDKLMMCKHWRLLKQRWQAINNWKANLLRARQLICTLLSHKKCPFSMYHTFTVSVVDVT